MLFGLVGEFSFTLYTPSLYTAAVEEKIKFLTDVFLQTLRIFSVPNTLFLKYFFGFFSLSFTSNKAAK